MPTYDEFRAVLKRLDFKLVRSKKHETWQKILSDGIILQVRLSHQHGKDIPMSPPVQNGPTLTDIDGPTPKLLVVDFVRR